MKSLLEITHSVLQDCSMQCGANPSRDGLTIARRVKHEGESFLTISLPAFCEDFDKSLASGSIAPALASRFKTGRGTSLPRFLGGFLAMVFDSSGLLLPCPSTVAIRCIRQILLLHKKILLPCSIGRVRKAEKKYTDIELELRAHVTKPHLRDVLRRVSAVIVSDLVRKSSFGDPYSKLRPRHGPGTTAEGVRGNGKFLFPSWPSRLEAILPFSEFGVLSLRNSEAVRNVQDVTYTPPRHELPVKVVFVPKTLKSPRVIACEPIAMQFGQQAIAGWLRECVELHSSYMQGRVNFTRQSINSNLARLSSGGSLSLATLDLSDASDRVSARLVLDVVRSVPALRRLIFGTRSTRAKLPNGEVIVLRKFASMGSALCFPIEAIVFFCTIVAGRVSRSGARPTPRTIKHWCKELYVYGDDIIVPNDEAPAVIACLEDFGLKVNAAKSFWTGKFRESCGLDAYDNEVVTPIYCRRPLPNHRADVHGLVSAVSFANQLYAGGFWKSAQMVRLEVEKILGPLPSLLETDPGLGWLSYSNARSHNGWDKALQRLKTRCYVPIPTMREDPLNGDPALLKCLLGLEGRPPSLPLDYLNPPVSSEHLCMSVRYGNLALKRRWI